MNVFFEELNKLSASSFSFFCGGEYIVCVCGYEKSELPKSTHAYIDKYYEISNSQYHKAREFCGFCSKFGIKIESEREKPYKEFLFANGFFQRGKNTLLSDAEFGSKMYFTVLKVAKNVEEGKSFGEYFASIKAASEYFISKGYSEAEALEIANGKVKREFAVFLQVLKSKQSRYKRVSSSGGGQGGTTIASKTGSGVDFSGVVVEEGDFSACKNCNICVLACPQNALPNHLERCLRAKMQEGKVEAEFADKLENRVLGCEICSGVCPKNSKIATCQEGGEELSDLLIKVSKKDSVLTAKYGKNIISKNKLTPYILNAMGNSGDIKYVEIVESYVSAENANVQIAAKIALEKLLK